MVVTPVVTKTLSSYYLPTKQTPDLLPYAWPELSIILYEPWAY